MGKSVDLSKGAHGSRAPQWVKDARIERIADLLMEGNRPEDVVQYAAQEWDIQRRQTCAYMAKARELISAKVRELEGDPLETHIAARRHLLNLVMQGKPVIDKEGNVHRVIDESAALRILDSEAKLLGLLNDKTKVEHSGTVDHNHQHQLLPYGEQDVMDGEALLAAARAQDQLESGSAPAADQETSSQGEVLEAVVVSEE